jgi:protein-disulfide isomerase
MSRRLLMLASLLVLTALVSVARANAQATAQATAPTTVPAAPQSNLLKPEELKKIDKYLRNLFAWGPDFQLKLGTVAPSPSPEIYEIPIEVTTNGQTDSGSVYITKDAKFLIRGEIKPIGADPFAENRSKIHLEGAPFRGPATAKVVVVDYSDFECPHCQQLYRALKTLQTKYPQVKFVSKSFPLTQIHPWALNAAIGAQCALNQSPQAYWQVHDALFDNQDVLSAENIWDKLISFAAKAAIPQDTFRACMASPEAKAAVQSQIEEGQSLKLQSTPTVYINGRESIGADPATLDQYIRFDLPPTN